MRTFVLLVGAAWVLTLSTFLTMAEEKQQAKSFKAKITRTVSADYLLYLPGDYDGKSRQRWPLILGVIYIAVTLFAPAGLFGLRWRRRRAVRAP